EATRPSAGSAPSIKIPPTLKGRLLRIIALVAPYIFVMGLVTLVAVGVERVLQRRTDGIAGYWRDVTNYRARPWSPLTDPVGGTPSLLLLAAGLLFVSILVSWRIGVNEFSMHHFYRNRLVRCYLGASRWRERRADWFTGFDSKDDLLLKEFMSAKAYQG